MRQLLILSLLIFGLASVSNVFASHMPAQEQVEVSSTLCEPQNDPVTGKSFCLVGMTSTATSGPPSQFLPSTLTVKPGTTVRWVNTDTSAHTVTSGTREDGPNGLFDSGLLMPNQQFEYTFSTPGVYYYFCIPHLGMAGQIIVQGEIAEQTATITTMSPSESVISTVTVTKTVGAPTAALPFLAESQKEMARSAYINSQIVLAATAVAVILASLLSATWAVLAFTGRGEQSERKEEGVPIKTPRIRVDRIITLVATMLLVGIIVGVAISQGGLLNLVQAPTTGVVRSYTLIIEPADLQVAPNAVWHAWTYNGTVPGPTLYGYVGDTLRIRVINKLNLTHTLHTHLFDYDLSSDGSQINLITGVGAGAYIPPGKEYTYEFPLKTAGLFYYHCHSSDHFHILEHIRQGLYGAIIVDDPSKPKPDHDYVIFMTEIGHNIEGKGAPFYIMDGMAIPGGESALEQIYLAGGLPAVLGQLNKTVLTFTAKPGETVRLNVINIGDIIHSFHLHGQSLTSQLLTPGNEVPGNVIELAPGGVEQVILKPMKPGVWLFHCHVVSHADMGMIGLFIVG